jgi:hypothetical protein
MTGPLATSGQRLRSWARRWPSPSVTVAAAAPAVPVTRFQAIYRLKKRRTRLRSSRATLRVSR